MKYDNLSWKLFITSLSVVLCLAAILTTPHAQAATGCVEDPLTPLSDEFNDPATFSNWSSQSPLTSVFDFTTNPGFFTVVTSGNAVWFNNEQGTFLSKLIDGDFIAETRVIVEGMGGSLTGNFRSGGLVVEDPGESSDWIMYNNGLNDGLPMATERKRTDVGASTLSVNGVGSLAGRLRMCRVGDDFHLFRCLDGDGNCNNPASWTEENTGSNPISPINKIFPNEVNVGAITSSFTGTSGMLVRFDYLRFGVPTDVTDCLKDLAIYLESEVFCSSEIDDQGSVGDSTETEDDIIDESGNGASGCALQTKATSGAWSVWLSLLGLTWFWQRRLRSIS